MKFSIYAVFPFITFILIFLEGLFVYLNNPKSKLNIIYALFCVSLCIWLFNYTFMYLSTDPISGLFWARNGFFGVIFIPIFAYHFVSSFLNDSKDKILKFLYISALPSIIFFRTPLVYQNVISHYWGYYPRAGLLYVFFLVCFLVGFCGSVVKLFLALYDPSNKNDFQKRSQIKYLIFAFGIGATGVMDYVIKFPNIEVYPWGYISAFGLITFFGIAILKHKLLDIELIVKRTAVFAGLFAFVYGIFTVITVAGQEFFRSTLGWNQWIAMIPTVAIITFALRPLEIFLTNATEKFLFQKKYDYKELLKVFTNEILTVIDLQELTQNTVKGLINIVKLESVAVLLHDKAAKDYKIIASFNIKEKDLVFKDDHILAQYLKKASHPIQKDKNVEGMESGDLKEAFKALNAQVCIPIDHHDELIGMLSLGTKKSGEEYTAEDLDILMTLARTEAIAIANAQLFDELSKTQAEAAQREKMAVIGTLAAGINHEICNPLGIVRGQCEMFLLNLRDGFYGNKNGEEVLKISSEIMNKVIKETDRATNITKKLSSFARPSKQSDFEEVSVGHEIDEVLGLLGHDLKISNIDIQKDFPDKFPLIIADKKQIEEVLFNIIRNAAQAMDKKDGRIMVSGFVDGDSVAVRIADNGSGIPAEKIEQIFHPFYTTKAPGKGTGLGLFIVKQVVERNNGSIDVESQIGVGTTFTLRFQTAVATLTARSR